MAASKGGHDDGIGGNIRVIKKMYSHTRTAMGKGVVTYGDPYYCSSNGSYLPASVSSVPQTLCDPWCSLLLKVIVVPSPMS